MSARPRFGLPATAYAFHENAPPGERIVALKCGLRGYWRTSLDDQAWCDAEARAEVERMNQVLGVGPVQLRSMLAGCLFGFQVPAADPRHEPPTPASPATGGAAVDPTHSLLQIFALRAAAI
jgi:hypothetical protein